MLSAFRRNALAYSGSDADETHGPGMGGGAGAGLALCLELNSVLEPRRLLRLPLTLSCTTLGPL
eukprot:5424242-Pyramimonas_sp.AAC.1